LPKQEVTDPTVGVFKKNLESMLHKKRLEYPNRKLRGIIQYGYKNSAAFKNRMDCVALKPKDI
jgi:phenylacetate-coenzyme A ligase PaaK-like adenylate-forming protein